MLIYKPNIDIIRILLYTSTTTIGLIEKGHYII